MSRSSINQQAANPAGGISFKRRSQGPVRRYRAVETPHLKLFWHRSLRRIWEALKNFRRLLAPDRSTRCSESTATSVNLEWQCSGTVTLPRGSQLHTTSTSQKAPRSLPTDFRPKAPSPEQFHLVKRESRFQMAPLPRGVSSLASDLSSWLSGGTPGLQGASRSLTISNALWI